VYEFLKHIGFDGVHQVGESATTSISTLRASLTMLKKRQGQAIPLFFSYAKQARKTNLKAVQLRFLGL
jgi:hypothetical protein